MRTSRAWAGALPVACIGVLSLLLLLPSSAAAAWTPDWEAPFVCGQDWSAGTYDGHSPSWFAVDFNRADDFRAPVRATAAGRVTAVENLGDTSYGKYIRIEHGHGYESLYAHLDAQFVAVGQRVDQGQVIALLGTTGGSTGPHLHFEEKHDGTVLHAAFHQVSLDYNTTITSDNCADVPIAGDWNGDRRVDVGVFRPRPGHNAFRLRRPDGRVSVIRFGRPGDMPLTGDWNGNGVTDVGVWRRMTKTFLLRYDNGSTHEISMGKIRDVPIVGDWDGDGHTDVGVFSPGRSSFRLRAGNGSVSGFSFGSVGSTPIAGDWNGDGRTDVGVYDLRTTSWRFRSGTGHVRTQKFGGVGGIPVTGDWNGDGTDTAATWGPTTALFRLDTHKLLTLTFGRKRR